MQTLDTSVGEPPEQPGQGTSPTPSAPISSEAGFVGSPDSPDALSAAHASKVEPEVPTVSDATQSAHVDPTVSVQSTAQSSAQSSTRPPRGRTKNRAINRIDRVGRGRQAGFSEAEIQSQRYQLAAVIVLAAAVGLVMWAVAIREVLFNRNTATGGDMGAHVWTADFVVRKLVPQGRVTGWSDDWFAGFSVLGFYFPFPFWIMTLLDLVGLPYTIAFKLVTVLGLVGMPLTGFAMGHFAGLKKPLPVFCGLATLPFLFDQQFAIYGGNIKSTMAGEFSFALSLCLGLLFLGLLVHIMNTGQRRATAAAVLAMTGLSHLLPTIWVGVAGSVLILTHLDAKRTNIRNAYALFGVCAAITGAAWAIGHERYGLVLAALVALGGIAYDARSKRLGLGQFSHAFTAVAAGAALAAFWIWPFWNHLDYTNDMGYEKEQRYLWGLFPWVSQKPEASAAVFFFAFCLAIIGASYSFATFGRSVRARVRTSSSWHSMGSAFCFAGSLLVTAALWNKVVVLRQPGTSFWERNTPIKQGQTGWVWRHVQPALVDLTSWTTLCRLMVFALALVVLHVLVMAWTLEMPWERFGVGLSIVTAICGIVYRFSPYGFRLWNNRILPFWLMGIYVMAGFGVYALCKLASRVFLFAKRDGFIARNRALAGLGAGVLATHAAIAVPLGLVPRWAPIPTFSRGSTVVTKADGTKETKASGGWRVGVRTAGASGDYDASAAKGWPPYNYQGYESRGNDWKDYKGIVDKMAEIGKSNGCGRAHWEYEGKQERWGTPMALMLLPYWTDSCIQSMEGLYFESAATAPFHWLDAGLVSKSPSNPQRDLPYKGLDLSVGIPSLADFGVKYYMAFSTVAISQADQNPQLKLLGTAPYIRKCDDAETKASTCPTQWKIYEVSGSELVVPMKYQPVVATGIGQSQQDGWLDLAVSHFSSPDRYHDVPVVASVPQAPPATWQRIKVNESRDPRGNKEFGATVTFDDPKQVELPSVTVSNIKAASLGTGNSKPGSLSFHVDKVGVPVVVKMSYFPNFRVKGAKGPYRSTNNQMVVIPTKNDVSISFKWDRNDYLGFLAGLGGIGLCVAMWRADKRTRNQAEAERMRAWRAQRKAAQP